MVDSDHHQSEMGNGGRRLIGFGTCVAAGLGAVLVAQAPPRQVPTFRSRVDLVHLDVSVIDKDRRPVRGLTQADFAVFEDGQPQKVDAFEAIDIADPEPPPAAWMRDVTPDVTTNEVRPTRLWVLAVDDALIPTDPFSIKSAKDIVRQIIDRFGPEDYVAVVFTADSRRAQDFTNDRTKLLATLDRFSPGWASWRGNTGQDPQFWLGAINTMLNVMDSLVAVPHARRAMIWVTPGIPMDVWAKAAGSVTSRRMDHLRLIDLTGDLFDIARRANVAVYPVDPIPVDRLPPGQYLLTFEATIGEVRVRRDLRFRRQ
jgi:VWFA-related protein